jgi:hypothetical protein
MAQCFPCTWLWPTGSRRPVPTPTTLVARGEGGGATPVAHKVCGEELIGPTFCI